MLYVITLTPFLRFEISWELLRFGTPPNRGLACVEIADEVTNNLDARQGEQCFNYRLGLTYRWNPESV